MGVARGPAGGAAAAAASRGELGAPAEDAVGLGEGGCVPATSSVEEADVLLWRALLVGVLSGATQQLCVLSVRRESRREARTCLCARESKASGPQTAVGLVRTAKAHGRCVL